MNTFSGKIRFERFATQAIHPVAWALPVHPPRL